MARPIQLVQNVPDQWLATNGLANTHDDARESIASRGSALRLWTQDAPAAARHSLFLNNRSFE
jgi:hypothetical protein